MTYSGRTFRIDNTVMQVHDGRQGIAVEQPDVESSSEEYAQRFSGPVGEFFLKTQLEAILGLLPHRGAILDVGGGHAQVAAPLLQAGRQVTVFGSDASCRQRLDRILCEQGGTAPDFAFATGSLYELPFDDNSFETVLALRLLPHLQDWKRFLAELCRISSHAVIFDYPDTCSINWLSSLLFSVKKKIEKTTRTFQCFSQGDITRSLHELGYVVDSHVGQYVLPMALHRLVGSARFSQGTEALARRCGLATRFGSPVILKAVCSSFEKHPDSL